MERPNVVLVMTDDQGYGDLGCTGNPWIRTPNIDRFYEEAVRFTDFHVSPLCTPTRGAIMSGKNPLRNGAWATCWGRSILRRDETTMADVFAGSGYRTGMFGKWHLGDNYPYRPQDRGFQKVVAHKGGGVGQTPDYWGNNYFDDTYFHNGEPVPHDGYCTDVWFDEAMAFIEENKDAPFFCYLVTNAPHSPYLVADRYKAPYVGNPDIVEPAFYGMITNIDENFGKLDAKLEELGLRDNTILIFMTDNGSSGGSTLDAQSFVTKGFNAGMRGKKASYYDGGHRVPFFIRWPDGGVAGGLDVAELSTHTDLLPTFIDVCGLEGPERPDFDGRSFGPLLRKETEVLPDRTVFLQFRQDTNPPEKWTNGVMTRQWRLIRGEELYDIKADPGQRMDVASENPDVVARLRGEHEAWWEEVSPRLSEYCAIALGNRNENPTRLNSMDVMGDVAWNPGHILKAQKSTGMWSVEVEEAGRYRLQLRRWPTELGLPIDAALSPEAIADIPFGDGTCETIHPVRATMSLLGKEYACGVTEGDVSATFEIDVIQVGDTLLEAWFVDEAGERRGAYYVDVALLD